MPKNFAEIPSIEYFEEQVLLQQAGLAEELMNKYKQEFLARILEGWFGWDIQATNIELTPGKLHTTFKFFRHNNTVPEYAEIPSALLQSEDIFSDLKVLRQIRSENSIQRSKVTSVLSKLANLNNSVVTLPLENYKEIESDLLAVESKLRSLINNTTP